MPYIHSVHTALPEHYYSQEQLTKELMEQWSEHFHNPKRILDIQKNVLVGGRHLAMPMGRYKDVKGFGEKNRVFHEQSLKLVYESTKGLLERADMSAEKINALFSSTVTGISVPSLEARLMNKLPFQSQTKRIPIFGLGCLAGVAGINRAVDYLKGHPKEAVVFFSVELCSLTSQLQDMSIANIISSGLFGDGAAAVLLLGDEHPRVDEAPLRWKESRSTFFPDTERVMGWDMIDTGFKVVLSKDVPQICQEHLPKEVEALVQSAEVDCSDINFYMSHPGGPKVLEAMQDALGLTNGELELSWKGLREYGNMSSVSVLFVLKEMIEQLSDHHQLGLMTAMGPAFCAEMSLWQKT